MSCLYILEIKLLLVTSFANIFSHSAGCLFIVFIVSFAVQKLVSFIRSHLFLYLTKIYYLFMAVLDFHCCEGFSLVAVSRGYSLVVVRGFLIVVASLVAEPRL